MTKLFIRKTHGFTLVEIIVVVVIIGIFASAFMWALSSFYEKSMAAEAKEILTKAFGGYNRLVVEGESTWGTGSNWSQLGFDWDPNGFDVSRRHFDYVFDDPNNPNTLTATRTNDATRWIMIDLRSGRITNSGFYGK
jgi:prepilin-type N-terminal cleavage/methylation domain-containing protein